MRVVVPTVTTDCAAHLALDAEFVNHEVIIVEGPHGYGKLLRNLWAQGRGFIIVEHDIVPWPGAIRSFEECDEVWCCFEYPLNFEYVSSLGCTKFSDRLVASHARIARDAETIHWGALDGTIIPRLRMAVGPPHIHNPPVAHVRRY